MPDNTCRWKPKLDPGYVCHELPLPNGYCILHSKEDKDIEQFKEKVKERIEKGRLTPAGWETNIIDLRGCYFPKNFPSDFFIRRTFDKPVYFTEATFSQEAYFGWATFSQEAYFGGAKFSQEAYFGEATFSQGADFLGATFSQKADFSGATFSQANFRWATFSQADFGRATFSQANFYEATFSQEAYFREATFSQADFRKATFSQGADFSYIRSSEEVIFQDVDLSQCSFLHSNIDKVDFRYCTFGEKGRRQNILNDELNCDENVAKKKADRKDYEHVRRLYLELKRNFEEKKDWNTAGDFHFGEMECRRKMKGFLGRYLSLEAFYCWASGYGERPLRAILILLGFVLIVFPYGYWLSGSSFSTSIWDSVQVATLMRLGNPVGQHPGGWKFIVALLEIIFVPPQAALLALALRRKVKR